MAPRRPRPSGHSASGSAADPEAAGRLRRRLGPDRRRRGRSRPSTSPEYNFLERGLAFESPPLLRSPATLVRLAEESRKPNDDRLREYRESNLPIAEARPLLRGADLSRVRDGQARQRARLLAGDDRRRRPGRPRVLQRPDARGGGPRAGRGDGARRRRGPQAGSPRAGLEAIEASDDPMIKLALAVDAEARAVRKRLGGRGRGRRDGPVRPDRHGPLRGPGRLGLPRRHLHAPAGLRHRQGVDRGRRGDPALHPDRRRSSSTPRRGATPTRSASPIAGSRRRRRAGSTSTRR